MKPRLSSFYLAILAFLAACAAVWPPIHLLIVGANLPTYYMENIGWRFFWVQRFITHVPGDYIHPGQGVLMPLIQSTYYLGGKALGLDLFGEITLFGNLTLAIGALGLVGLALLIAFDEKIGIGVRAALVTSPLVMALGGFQIFAYDLYPDYLAYTKIFFLLFGWRLVHYQAADGGISPHSARELGLLGGLLTALKINYLLWPVGLVLIALVAPHPKRIGDVIRMGSIAAFYGVLTLFGLLLIFYYGNGYSVLTFFTVLFGWAPSLNAVLSFPLNPLGSDDASVARLTALLFILCLVAVVPLRARAISAVLTALIIAAAALAMAYLRGGSSIFDAVVMLAVLCAVFPVALGGRRVGQIGASAVAAVFVAWPGAWTLMHWQNYETVSVSGHKPLITLGEAGDWQRGLFNWDMSHGLPIYVLSPTNYETQGSIEDMISMGGLQNFGGAPSDPPGTLRALYPRIHYLYYDSPGFPLTLPPERLVFWHVTGTPAPDFPHLDAQTFDSHERQVARALEGRRIEDCYRVTQFMTRQEIVSCVIGAKDEPG